MSFTSLRLSTWAVIVATLLLLAFLLVGVIAPDPVEAWYWRTYAAAALHEDLGFAADQVGHPEFSGTALVITSVAPGAIFEQSGVRPAIGRGTSTVVGRAPFTGG